MAAVATLCRSRPFILAALAGTVLMVPEVAFLNFLALDLTDRFQHDPVAAAGVLGYVHAGGLVGRLLWGWGSDRLSHGHRLPLLRLASGLGSVILVLLAVGAPRAVPVGLFGVVGGMALLGWAGLHTTLIAELVGPGLTATAIGLTMTSLYVAATLTSPAFGALVDVTGSYPAAWSAVGLVALAAIPLLSSIRERAAADTGLP
jgi:sugar phosphate permease